MSQHTDTLELTVDGMRCGGCSGRLKKALDGTDGIQSSDIVLETKRVTVSFDTARIAPAAIRERIEETGFTVVD